MNPNTVSYFAQTDARNQKVPFGIKSKDRSRHMYVIGKTGMGKSTLLENLAVQDIQNGEGMAFLDPHGKTAELLLEYVPKERIKDVIYFAPFDTDHPISFNVMEDVGADKRHLVANGLMSAFKKIWVLAWSARMEYILNNILLALLEYPDSTLIGVNRMLADKDYRKKVVDNISDPSVKSFWVDEFAKYGERYMQEAGAAIQNKIGQFVSNPLVRNIIGQPKSTFDIRKIMDDRKILIINLSKGRVGEANANLLGSMLITKIYLGAMSRADASEKVLNLLPQFYLFVDEFQSFANESFADILSEARKYKLNLTVAHQYIEQMSEEVRAAVFGNVGTMIVFRVGAYDAEVLEKEFMPSFTAEDLVNLGFVQIYLKLMIDGVTSPAFSAVTLPPIKKQEINFKDEIIENSRALFARPKNIVEEEIFEWHKPVTFHQNDNRSFAKNSPQKSMAHTQTPMRGVSNATLHVSQTSQTSQTSHSSQRAAHIERPSHNQNPHTERPSHNQNPRSTHQQNSSRTSTPKHQEEQTKNPFKAIEIGNDGRLHERKENESREAAPPVSLGNLPLKGKKPAVDLKVPSKENVDNLKQALAALTYHPRKDSGDIQPEKIGNRTGVAVRHSKQDPKDTHRKDHQHPTNSTTSHFKKTEDIHHKDPSESNVVDATNAANAVNATNTTKNTISKSAPVTEGPKEVPESVLRNILDA